MGSLKMLSVGLFHQIDQVTKLVFMSKLSI